MKRFPAGVHGKALADPPQSETDFFDTLTIQNDQISYVKHVLAPLPSSRCLAEGNRIYHWVNLVGPILVHKTFGSLVTRSDALAHVQRPLLYPPSPIGTIIAEAHFLCGEVGVTVIAGVLWTHGHRRNGVCVQICSLGHQQSPSLVDTIVTWMAIFRGEGGGDGWGTDFLGGHFLHFFVATCVLANREWGLCNTHFGSLLLVPPMSPPMRFPWG